MGGRWRSALSWVLAALAAVALTAGAALTYAEHTIFRSEAFADHVAATLDVAPVRAAAARRIGDAVISAAPDLPALRPIVGVGARAVVGTAPFRALVRRAALNAHRAAFDADRRQVALRGRDA